MDRGTRTRGRGILTTPHYPLSMSLVGNRVIGILREVKSIWEARVPVTPSHAQALIKDGFRVVIQPSNTRAFRDEEYRAVGATVQEDLSEASTIIGIKEAEIKDLIPDRTYMFFSHTIKAQPYNMGLLDSLIGNNIRLLDYECIADSQGARKVMFGTFAGRAGMMDTFSMVGRRYIAKDQMRTPFLNLGMSHQYPSMNAAYDALKEAGRDIEKNGLPSDIAPFVVTFVGSGNVTDGAQECFENLPHEYVEPHALESLVKSGKASRHKVYGCMVDKADYMTYKPDPSQTVTTQLFRSSDPTDFSSHFATSFLPYTSVLLNGMYYAPGFPRILSQSEAEQHFAVPHPKCIGIADISCDIGGGIEITTDSCLPGKPYHIKDVATGRIHEDDAGPGVAMMTCDILPCEFPKEASQFFGDLLLPYLKSVAVSDGSLTGNADLPEECQNAVIVHHQQLTPNYQYIDTLRREGEAEASAEKQKNVLLLGAGNVAGPIVDYLLRSGNNHVTVASWPVGSAQALIDKTIHTSDPLRSNCAASDCNIGAAAAADQFGGLVEQADVVMSLLPFSFHPVVSDACLQHGKNMVTSSYISPALEARNAAASAAGLTFINEMGLDPGIDHLLAMDALQSLRDDNWKVLGFESWCGGLPSTECAELPLGYRFSWSPRGVLMAAKNDAQWLENGEVKKIVGGDEGGLLLHAKPLDDLVTGFAFEFLPNRDSLKYQDLYGLEDATTVMRGTLRYRGFSAILSLMFRLGLAKDVEDARLSETAPSLSWRQLCAQLWEQAASANEEQLLRAAHARLSLDPSSDIAQKLSATLTFLGVLSEQPVAKEGTILGALAAQMNARMNYTKDQADLVVLVHRFTCEHRQTGEKAIRRISYIKRGNPLGHTAMAESVGIPAAIAAQRVLNGDIREKGVFGPFTSALARPILEELRRQGFHFSDTTSRIH
jgi:alpha-aminoadipic semialdehyde synthase